MASCSLRHPPQEVFSPEDVQILWSRLYTNLNVSGTGAVVASHDHFTPGGSYFFHWARDAALVMATLLAGAGERSSVPHGVAEWMNKWLEWEQRALRSGPDVATNGIDLRVEVKFLIPKGVVFKDPWCRPQTDGPPLRALTLLRFARTTDAAANASFTATPVWGRIASDLDYTAEHWAEGSCDLWEEVWDARGDFFWNRFMARAALTVGAKVAAGVGEYRRAKRWRSEAESITSLLETHWDGKVVMESESANRRGDAAVLEAFNEGYLGDGVYGPLDVRVLHTLIFMQRHFCAEYAVNYARAGNVRGVLIGRYPRDKYAGGNPWILLSASFASVLYRASAELRRASEASEEQLTLLRELVGDSDLAREDLADALLGAGDGILANIKALAPDLHFTEQLSRQTGQPLGAADLTWSYANVLKALAHRSSASEGHFEGPPTGLAFLPVRGRSPEFSYFWALSPLLLPAVPGFALCYCLYWCVRKAKRRGCDKWQ